MGEDPFIWWTCIFMIGIWAQGHVFLFCVSLSHLLDNFGKEHFWPSDCGARHHSAAPEICPSEYCACRYEAGRPSGRSKLDAWLNAVTWLYRERRAKSHHKCSQSTMLRSKFRIPWFVDGLIWLSLFIVVFLVLLSQKSIYQKWSKKECLHLMLTIPGIFSHPKSNPSSVSWVLLLSSHSPPFRSVSLCVFRDRPSGIKPEPQDMTETRGQAVLRCWLFRYVLCRVKTSTVCFKPHPQWSWRLTVRMDWKT